tara:strand:+ start:468 stop:866 length:399 start_codon:yes stop_codon:yes gene_type:complete
MIRIYFIILLTLIPNIGFTESPEYPLFRDYVQYSSSVDAYSKMCVKNFEPDLVKSELFDLVNLLNSEIGLSNEDIELLKEKYNRINISTLSQLKRLGLDKSKRLCPNYLKVFERFDEKKNEKLNQIIELIEK